jgi:hypothetical protein
MPSPVTLSDIAALHDETLAESPESGNPKVPD